MKLTQIALFGLATANKTWHSKEWEVQDAHFAEKEIILSDPTIRKGFHTLANMTDHL